MRNLALLLAAMFFTAMSGGASAESVNIYSARHYDSDDALYSGFTEATGIQVNRIEGNGDELLARMKAEGRNSPADIFITVDAGNLWRAETEGLFQAVDSRVLQARIPENLRHPGNLWFGFATRARVIFVNPDKVDASRVRNYRDLADPALKGLVCMRSSSNIYNLSLLGAIISHEGEEAAQSWADGVVANFARPAQGNDTSQLLSVAAGECGVTLANHYYYIRLLSSPDPAQREAAAKLVLIWPDQDGNGTHVNISGAALLASAPHREAGIRFLEYLASDAAQTAFAMGNHEFPAVAGDLPPELERLGSFTHDTINVSVLGENQPLAQTIFDRAGWR